MATLIVSDLHLGNALGHDVLRRQDARERLWSALEGVERLVLLGDIVELMGRRPRAAMAVAEPVLRALGRHLGADREVIIVAGNHDAPLVRRWAAGRGPELGVDETVPLDASPGLAALADWLSPARVRAAYPGVWLTAGVWATHGHYLDRHLAPSSTIGLLRPPLRSDRRLRRPADYERDRRRQRRRQVTGLGDRLRERPLGTVAEELIGLARAHLVPALPRLAAGTGLAQLTAGALDLQMRRCAAPAMARVAHRLGIEAEWIVFGHVHRRGPLGEDDQLGDARRGSGAGLGVGLGVGVGAGGGGGSEGLRLVNTGAWLHEPLLLDGVRPPHPYWPGGAVRLGDDGRPRSLGLLDGVVFGPDPTISSALVHPVQSLTS